VANSEKKLEGQLDLPWVVRQACEASESRDTNRQDRGRSKLGLVEEVEKLRAELKPKAPVSRPQKLLE